MLRLLLDCAGGWAVHRGLRNPVRGGNPDFPDVVTCRFRCASLSEFTGLSIPRRRFDGGQ